ncbi:MAG: MATE family efflux transporter, partial [Pseudomonadota bacterium]
MKATVHKSSLSIAEEARRLLIIAGPLMAAYLAEYAMFVTTKLVVGRLGYKELAAVGLGGSLAFEMMVILAGLLSITGVFAAEAEGGGRKADAGNAARQGLIVAIILAVPMTIFVANLDVVFNATGQDPEVTALAQPFVAILAFFALPVLLFTALRDFVAALSRTYAVMVIAAAAVPVNWFLAEGLVHGRFGLPEMGVSGAAVAVVTVNWLMVFALFAFVWLTPALRGYGVIKGRLRVDWPVIRDMFRLGLPVAGLVAIEAGLFSAVGLLSGVI